MSGSRVLVVEDDPAIRRALTRELRGEFEVIVAETVEQALALFEATPGIVAVVSDYVLGPGRTGADLLAEVGRAGTGVARLLVSGSLLDQRDTSVLGADAFIAKPWERGEILRAVRELLAGTAGAEFDRFPTGTKP